ncbi:MAG: hypothetical protein QMD08_05865 [Actinomycetota bacterium]|nr:hypothetical protein [Actinomycetota bacterium]
MAIPEYLEDYKKESERRRKDHEAKRKAYQKYEKERAAAQANMHAEHMKAMDELRKETIRRSGEHAAKVSAFNKTLGKY